MEHWGWGTKSYMKATTHIIRNPTSIDRCVASWLIYERPRQGSTQLKTLYWCKRVHFLTHIRGSFWRPIGAMRSPLWAAVAMVFGSLVLENLTVAQTQEESKPLGNLTAGEIAKAQVNFEFSRKSVEFADSLSDAIQALHTFSELSKAQRALNAVRDGKFKCNNGQYVPLSSVCDGNPNCADGSDESEERQCNYLRDGDTVALKNGCGGFMSCCGGYVGRNDIITTSNCPGDTVDRLDWTRCSNIEFRVDLINRGRNRGPIRFGDEIKITSQRSRVCTNCQRHSYHWILFSTGFGNVCRATEATTDRCKTKVFARNRLGSCDGNVWNGCKGDLLRHGDVLYFLQGNSWISADGVNTWVFRRGCPGNKIGPWLSCRCEQWAVFRR